MEGTTAHRLRRRLAHGLRLGAAAVVTAAQARPPVGGAVPPPTATVLGEAALLCRVTGRLLADEPSLAVLEGLGAAQARLGEALSRALDPRAATLAVTADPRSAGREALPFALLGDLDTGHRSVARHLLDVAVRDELGDEPGTAQRLHLDWLRGLTEGCAAPEVPAGSVLERGADLLSSDLADTCALPDAVLHATDCGLLPPRSYRPATSVADDAQALLGATLSAGRLDLVLRLLATWPMLGLPLGADARYALAELDRAEDRVGFLPGPAHDPAVAAALGPADRSTYVIRTSARTGLAAALLSAALLRAGLGGHDLPVAHTGRVRGGDLTASALAAHAVPDDDPLPLLVLADGPWAGALRTAPLPERVACTEMVLGAELHAAATARDVGRVEHVVDRARAQGWAHLPSVCQGAELLGRVARAAARPVVLAS